MQWVLRMERIRSELALFILSEIIILGLFFEISRGVLVFYLYMVVTPFLFVVMSYYLTDVKKTISRTILSKDMVIFLVFLFAWLYIYSLTRNGLEYVFQTAYYPVFLEEYNFRFLMTRFLKRYVGEGRAIVIQAILYALAYASFLVYSPAGYPGLYAVFFVLDNFAMSCIYGAIYYLRKNIYIDISIHLSLYLMDVFLPASLGWLAYVSTPV